MLGREFTKIISHSNITPHLKAHFQVENGSWASKHTNLTRRAVVFEESGSFVSKFSGDVPVLMDNWYSARGFNLVKFDGFVFKLQVEWP